MLKFVPIGGFLGAGKTTTMIAAAKALEARGETVAVITNDQGTDLVDTQLAQAAQVDSVSEVTGGCFCCRFDDLAAVIDEVVSTRNPSVVLAEAVGSCTDLQSTVVRPLRTLHGDQLSVAPLAVLVDPLRYAAMSSEWRSGDSAGQDGGSSGPPESDMAYLYRHQLDEADVIVVNKADLLPDGGTGLAHQVQERFPHAQVLLASAKDGTGLPDLLQLWSTGSEGSSHRAFDIDYDRYGAAEAELAWTNQTFTTTASGDSEFRPGDWADSFLASLNDQAGEVDATIGHVKLRTETSDGPIKASLTGADGATYDDRHSLGSQAAAWTLNARVAMTPDELDAAIARAADAADAACATATSSRAGDIFQPGFPVPVHRM